MTKHVHGRCLQCHGSNISSSVGYAGFHLIQIVWVIAVAIVFKVAPLKTPPLIQEYNDIVHRTLLKHGSKRTSKHVIQHGRLYTGYTCCSVINHFNRTTAAMLTEFATIRFLLWGYTKDNAYCCNPHNNGWIENQHNQHCYTHFTDGPCSSVYGHASPCSVMYPTCQCSVSELFVARWIIIHDTVNIPNTGLLKITLYNCCQTLMRTCLQPFPSCTVQ
jgi:hypothetical protein